MKRPKSKTPETRSQLLLATLQVPLAVLTLTLPAHSAVTIQSHWSLGENPANMGLDASSTFDGEVNDFNNFTGSTILSANPSGIGGSTSYIRTSGMDFGGLWMFGAGSNDQTIPADNWGVQFMVRSSDHATIPIGDFRAVFGMAEGVFGGLVIEAANINGTVYWEVNRQAVANYIIPRNEVVAVTSDWTALALVKDAGTTNFFVNGQLAGSSTAPFNTSGLFAFGLQQNVGYKGFSGDFDEASFFTFSPGSFSPGNDLIPEPSALLLSIIGLPILLRRRR